MKKATKLVSGVLAALMATSAFTATGFAATKTPTKEDCDAAGEQKIYFQFPTDGTWGELPDLRGVRQRVRVLQLRLGNLRMLLYC